MTNREREFERTYKREKIDKYLKYTPLVGILILVYLSLHPLISYEPSRGYNGGQVTPSLSLIIYDFINSFDFSDYKEVLFTLIFIITLWTGYRYWLTKFSIIKYNKQLSEVLILSIFLIVFSRHIKVNTLLFIIYDLIMFLAFLIVLIGGTWLIMKIIDRIDLRSDLYCGVLKGFWVILLFFGIFVLSFGMGAVAFASIETGIFSIAGFILPITGLCIMALGAFSGQLEGIPSFM
jgi:hypothetical protein